VAERSAHSAETHALARRRLEEIRQFFIDQLHVAVGAGELPAAIDPDQQADALLGVVISIMTLGRIGVDRSMIDHVANQAIADLHARVVAV
jgi:hypothetical protein